MGDCISFFVVAMDIANDILQMIGRIAQELVFLITPKLKFLEL